MSPTIRARSSRPGKTTSPTRPTSSTPARIPTITFVSTSVEPSGERTAKVTGDLTLKGVTKPVTLDVTFSGETDAHPFAKVPAIGFSAVGTFKRSEFGLDYLLPSIVGDDVKVQIEGDFIQKPAA